MYVANNQTFPLLRAIYQRNEWRAPESEWASEWVDVCVCVRFWNPQCIFCTMTLHIDFGEEINRAKWYFIWSIQLHSRTLAHQINWISFSFFFFFSNFSVCSRTCTHCMQFIYANKFNIALCRRCGASAQRNLIVATWLARIMTKEWIKYGVADIHYPPDLVSHFEHFFLFNNILQASCDPPYTQFANIMKQE